MTTPEELEKTQVYRRGGLAWINHHPTLHRAINRTFVGILVIFAIIQLGLWGTSWQPMGRSLPFLVTYGMIVVVPLMCVAWLFFCSRVNRRVVHVVSALGVLFAIGFAAAVRRPEPTGDMELVMEWRWQPTRDERLDAYRAKAETAKPVETVAAPVNIMPEDMPAYRGANHDGVVVGPPLNEDWSSHPPKILWKHPVGGGYSQLAVVDDYAVTMEQRHDQEVVVCYEASTGRERWFHGVPGRFDEAMGGPGPRSTPTIDTGRIYALGALGHLECLDLATGKPIWSHELLTELKLSNSEWAMTSSPLVLEDRVIVNIGGYYGGGLIAVRRDNGEEIWRSEGIAATKEKPPQLVAVELEKEGDAPPPSDGDHAVPAAPGGGRNRAGYASPVRVAIDHVPMILNFDGLGLWGHSLDDGRPLWFHHFENGPGVNAAQPIVFPDGRIFISASYNVGCRMLRVSRDAENEWNVEVVWGGPEKPNRKMKSKFSSPLLVDGYLYGLDEGVLTCLDPATGDRKWIGSRTAPTRGRYKHGQMLQTNGLLVILSEEGDVVLVRPQPDQLVEIGQMHVLDGAKTWNPPALVRGKLYARNHEEMACVDLCSTDSTPQVAEKP